MHAQSLSCVWLFVPGCSVNEISQAKNTGVSCHFLLQGIFLTQGLNPCPPASHALAGGFFTIVLPKKPHI